MSFKQFASEGDCCICLESLLKRGRQTLPCGHVLHETCVQDMKRLGASGRCPLCGEASDDLTPLQVSVDKACLLYRRQLWDDCFRICSEVLDQDGTHAEMVCLQSELLFKGLGCSRDPHRAVELLEEQRPAGNRTVLTALANHYRLMGRLSDAEMLLKMLCDIDHAEAFLALAWLRHQQGNIPEATYLFKQSIDKGDMRAAFPLGHILSAAGNDQQAETLLRIAVAMGTHSSALLLSDVLKKQGRDADAEKILEDACERENDGALYALGKLRLEQGRSLEAERLFKEDTTGEYQFDSAFELGKIYMSQSRNLEAKTCLEKARSSGDDILAQDTQNLLDKLQQAPLHDSSIIVGTKVFISGLLSEAGRCLNGQSGDVVCLTGDKKRCGVKLDGGQSKSIKFENLIPITSDEHLEELIAQYAIGKSA